MSRLILELQTLFIAIFLYTFPFLFIDDSVFFVIFDLAPKFQD